MKLNHRIRSFLGRRQLQSDLKKLDVVHETVGFAEAQRIGILYDATAIEDFEYMKEFIKKTRSEYKKDLLSLGFVDKKQLPHSQFPQYGMDFFTRKDLDYRMIPTDPIVQNFINERFDILIHLQIQPCFPLQYVASLSQARFRVGRYKKNHVASYDMMINMKGDPGLKALLEEILVFLKKLN